MAESGKGREGKKGKEGKEGNQGNTALIAVRLSLFSLLSYPPTTTVHDVPHCCAIKYATTASMSSPLRDLARVEGIRSWKPSTR